MLGALIESDYRFVRGLMAPDEELVALRAGDERVLEELMRRHHGAMMRVAYAWCRDHQQAEDVVQEAWVTFIQSLDRFQGRSSLKTWLFGILMNIARARRRSESRIIPFASLLWRREQRLGSPTVDPRRFNKDGDWSDPPAAWDRSPEQVLVSKETLGVIDSTIAGLPSKYREVIILRDVAGWSAEETSALLGISAANQRVRLHRARAMVRQKLEDYLR